MWWLCERPHIKNETLIILIKRKPSVCRFSLGDPVSFVSLLHKPTPSLGHSLSLFHSQCLSVSLCLSPSLCLSISSNKIPRLLLRLYLCSLPPLLTMAPVPKSSRGRGGGTKSKRKSPGGKRLSSSSSNPTDSNYSPPSVTRKSLPQQYGVSPGKQHSASQQRSQQSSHQRLLPQPSTSHPLASHHTIAHPQAILFPEMPNFRDLDPPHSEAEKEDEDDAMEEQENLEDEPRHPPPDEDKLQRHVKLR